MAVETQASIETYFAKKINTCSECAHWKNHCSLGYFTKSTSKACHSAIEKTAKRGF
jgi:hypothetical protein